MFLLDCCFVQLEYYCLYKILKYADLLPYRKTDYIFDIDKFTSFEGKTGIYAVYTATRMKSILNKFSTGKEVLKLLFCSA